MEKTCHQFVFIIILFILISLAFSLVIPVFNAPDEPFHFEYIQFLAKNKSLPNQTIANESISTEGFNPPLYYFIKAIFLSFLSPNKAADIKIHNHQDIARFYNDPSKGFRTEIYPPLNPDYVKWPQGKDKNMFLTTKEDRFPFSDSVRVLHLLRIISVFFGCLTIIFIFKTAHIIFPNNKNLSLLAASLCAFNPQFNFLSGSLNNDNLVILWATMAIWLLTKLMLNEYNDQKKIMIFLGLCIGFGFITKVNLSGIALIVVIGIIYKSMAERQEKFKSLFTNLILFIGPIGIISGWYFVRNVYMYGLKDPLGWRLQAIQNPTLILPAHYKGVFFKKIFFQRLFTSFWGLFDWLTIFLPNWAYWIYGLISMMGIAGLVNSLWGERHPKRIKMCFLLYFVAIFITIANLVILNFTFLSAQARLIFPAMVCICIFIALGIDIAFRYITKLVKIKAHILVYGFILLLIGLDLYALVWVIYPIYR